jgi:chorismate mutase
MNPFGLAALAGALWWLTRLNRNPAGEDFAGYVGGIDGRSSAVMRQLANRAGYSRSIAASKRKAAEAKAEAEAAEVEERERYRPVVVGKPVYKKHDFFMRPNGDGSYTRVPMRGSWRPQDDGSPRYGLGDRYQSLAPGLTAG